MTTSVPEGPKPKAVIVDITKTALLVLDGSQRWTDPTMACHKLVPGVSKFLDRARRAGLPVIFTISARKKETPDGEVCSDLNRRLSEPVIYPDGFDKFTGGELQAFLGLYNIDTLIMTGYRSNISVLYTATKAARELKYNVVIPMDGIATTSEYEQQYTLYQFTVLPTQASRRFSFTTLDEIQFQ